MNVYLRKLFPHDLTHEVSITENIIADFFKGKKEGLTFYKEGDPNRLSYPIRFYKAKDSPVQTSQNEGKKLGTAYITRFEGHQEFVDDWPSKSLDKEGRRIQE